MSRLESQSSIADHLTWKEQRTIPFKHETVTTLLEKLTSTELMLAGEVLATHKENCYQPVHRKKCAIARWSAFNKEYKMHQKTIIRDNEPRSR